MNISTFGKSTPAIIIFTAFTFLTVFACGVPATPNLMAPWSALAFFIIGCVSWSASSPRVESLAPHRIGAILVFTIGAVVSGEHLLNAGSTAFDRLLFPKLLPRTGSLPGRPAQLAGFRYCLLGVMLFLARARARRLVLAREWTPIPIPTISHSGFLAVIPSPPPAAPHTISP